MKKRDYKSLITNVLAAFLCVCGYLSPGLIGEYVLTAGTYSLSGAITNWLAIFMLFEKIPFLYGSGVIPLQFESFKRGIKDLIMLQFFKTTQIAKFLESDSLIDKEQIKTALHKRVDVKQIYEELVDSIMQSPFAGMLQMFGGRDALAPLENPLTEKINKILEKITDDFDLGLEHKDKMAENIGARIESIVDNRLNELTPTMVKDIIQNMIREHLGWLVVWGGVFGGIIGVGAVFIRTIK